jgi:hypothetical protein
MWSAPDERWPFGKALTVHHPLCSQWASRRFNRLVDYLPRAICAGGRYLCSVQPVSSAPTRWSCSRAAWFKTHRPSCQLPPSCTYWPVVREASTFTLLGRVGMALRWACSSDERPDHGPPIGCCSTKRGALPLARILAAPQPARPYSPGRTVVRANSCSMAWTANSAIAALWTAAPSCRWTWLYI